jgi:hypothetical protein
MMVDIREGLTKLSMREREYFGGVSEDDGPFSDRVEDGVYVNEPRVGPICLSRLHCDDSSPNGRILDIVGHTCTSTRKVISLPYPLQTTPKPCSETWSDLDPVGQKYR